MPSDMGRWPLHQAPDLCAVGADVGLGVGGQLGDGGRSTRSSSADHSNRAAIGRLKLGWLASQVRTGARLPNRRLKTSGGRAIDEEGQPFVAERRPGPRLSGQQ
jgi:hypothetical protein